jgi:hypothetical protein
MLFYGMIFNVIIFAMLYIPYGFFCSVNYDLSWIWLTIFYNTIYRGV